MVIITDDISRLERLDQKYGKLADSPEDAEKRERIGEKIIKVRETIVSELEDRKERIEEHRAKYLARNPDAEDSPKIQDLTRRHEHIDRKIKEIDSIIDPSLIRADAAESSSRNEETGNSSHSSSHDEEPSSILDSNE